MRFEPEAAEPAPAAPATPSPGPYAFFGPTSRSTHPATSPVEALVRTPEITPEPEAPAPDVRVETEPLSRADIGEFGDLDLSIPAPAAESLVVPIGGMRARARARRASPLIPILAASAVGVVGLGVLVLLMNAGQHAAPPSPAALPPTAPATTPPPEASVAPTVEAAPLAPPLPAAVAAATPAQPAAPAAKPARQRLAAAVRAPAATAPAAIAPQPYVIDVPPPEAEPTRITIPPPAPEPLPPPRPRVPAPGPDQPMATHPPD